MGFQKTNGTDGYTWFKMIKSELVFNLEIFAVFALSVSILSQPRYAANNKNFQMNKQTKSKRSLYHTLNISLGSIYLTTAEHNTCRWVDELLSIALDALVIH